MLQICYLLAFCAVDYVAHASNPLVYLRTKFNIRIVVLFGGMSFFSSAAVYSKKHSVACGCLQVRSSHVHRISLALCLPFCSFSVPRGKCRARLRQHEAPRAVAVARIRAKVRVRCRLSTSSKDRDSRLHPT